MTHNVGHTMRTLLLQLLCLGAMFGYLHGYYMVLAPVGTCKRKLAYVRFSMKRYECATMGGRWYGHPGAHWWIQCHIDLCDLPAEGAVSSGYAWGIDTDQTDGSSSTRVYGVLRTTRGNCDNLRGRYHYNPGIDAWLKCHLYYKRMDGTSRDNIDSYVMASDGEYPTKLAYGAYYITHRECTQIGGAWKGNPGANTYIECSLEICPSPVINCEPSDAWVPVFTCRNPSQAVFTCTFSLTNGIENGTSSESSSGGGITTEVSMGLETKFLNFGVSVTTDFNWETTKGSHTIWSKSTTRVLHLILEPQQSVRVSQIIGRCGDYKINTEEYSTQDVFLD